MKRNNNLYLFTSQFPFGTVSETFLETEIQFLAQHFETIIIVPTSSNDFCRNLPSNVIVRTEFSDLKFSKTKKMKSLLRNLLLTIHIVFSEIKSKGLFVCMRNRKILFDYLGEQLSFKQIIEHGILNQKENTVFYDYWFSNRTLALSILKRKYPTLKFVARAHGFDLYDERWDEIGVPFRDFKIKYIDRVYFISKHGFDYFKTKVNKKHFSKMHLSRLGVSKVNQILKNNSSNCPLIVTVSRVVPFKNITKIPKLLSKLGVDVKWILFGDGEEMDKVRKECDNISNKVQIELRGHIENVEMINFFKSNKVDLFLSLSSSEGLPVSMMEALSFGIPIVSTNVGGVPEIVINEKTGFLINDDNEALEIIKKALNYSFSNDDIRDFFDEEFNADINYTKFSKSLCYL